MIPQIFVEQWRAQAPWQALAMVEQDLVISRALTDLYLQPTVQKELVFRGGTALNKLYIKPASRYSEDLDFVQIEAKPIGNVITEIRDALDGWLGEPKRKFTERSTKLIYRYQSVDNTPARLKIEINTSEHVNVLPLKYMDYSVNSEWYQGSASIFTYELDELMGTKLRALYQRRKGRDLYDLWLVLSKKLVNSDRIIDIFRQYCIHNNEIITRKMFQDNLLEKQQHKDFIADMSILLNTDNGQWDIDNAFDIVNHGIISKLD